MALLFGAGYRNRTDAYCLEDSQANRYINPAYINLK